MIVNVFLTKAK